MSEDIQEDMLEHHREKGLTYKDVKEYAEEQKKAAEEEQIDGQLSIEDINDGACQNLTPEENSDQNEVVMVRVPTEEEREYAYCKDSDKEITEMIRKIERKNTEECGANFIKAPEVVFEF